MSTHYITIDQSADLIASTEFRLYEVSEGRSSMAQYCHRMGISVEEINTQQVYENITDKYIIEEDDIVYGLPIVVVKPHLKEDEYNAIIKAATDVEAQFDYSDFDDIDTVEDMSIYSLDDLDF